MISLGIFCMDDFSTYIFDLVQNAFAAKANRITIKIVKKERLKLIIKNNGKPMSKTEIKQVISPFYTTRNTRKVGLGIPLMILLTQQTKGSFYIQSNRWFKTKFVFTFNHHHIDFPDEGDYIKLIRDIFIHQDLSVITFKYKDKYINKTFKYKKEKHQYNTITNEMHQYMNRIEDSDENFRRFKKIA